MGKRIRNVYEPDTIAAQAAGSALVLPTTITSTSIPPVTTRTPPPLSSDAADPPPSTAFDLAALVAALPIAPSTTQTVAPLSTLPSLPPLANIHPTVQPAYVQPAYVQPAYVQPAYVQPASVQPVGLAKPPLFSPPSDASEAFNWLREQAQRHPAPWELLVGLYFQHRQLPMNVLPMVKRPWRLDPLKLDALELDSNHPVVDRWVFPTGDKGFEAFFAAVDKLPRETFEMTVRWWAACAPQRVEPVLNKSGWTNDMNTFSPPWQEMKKILLMDNGVDKKRILRYCRRYWPRYLQECLDDIFCGNAKYVTKPSKRKASENDQYPDYLYNQTPHRVRYVRVIGTVKFVKAPSADVPSAPKKAKMAFEGQGRPTQFHGVPLEERAIDSKGNRLPWALQWPDDHPNAHGQKRIVQEKGPFGKSMRRRGSSRTRTATPAKKENPTLDGFEQAMRHDLKKAAEAQQEANESVRPQNDGTGASRHVPTYEKEPTSVMLYGYSSATQWAAIDTFEKSSHGMICEDYEREPPAEFRKYPKTYSSTSSVHRRPLTKQERQLAFKYAGGEHWIKITFDSAEAADRAMEVSPANIFGHWVYAELYHGTGPEFDRAIPIQEGDQFQGKPARKPAQTLSAAFAQQASNQQRATATLPRSFNPTVTSQADDQRPNKDPSSSPSTASSATATGPEYPNLRNRHTTQDVASTQNPAPAQIQISQQYNPRMMKHFQDRPRTVLRPAQEAFLPVPTWTERQIAWLRANGLIPGDFIGDGLPLNANGEFDWNAANLYWRICYLLDKYLRTDFCGLKED